MSILVVSVLLLCSAFGPSAAVASLSLQAGLVDQSAYERRGSGLDREVLKRPLLTWGGTVITALAASRHPQRVISQQKAMSRLHAVSATRAKNSNLWGERARDACVMEAAWHAEIVGCSKPVQHAKNDLPRDLAA